MLRTLMLATLFFSMPGLASGQAPSVLRVTVALLDAEQRLMPVPRHALLVSDNPASAPPRRVLTRVDGTAEVPLRPGSYTVESDQPVAFNGQAYQWTQMIEIVAGRDATLALTADNAEVEPVTSSATAAAEPLAHDASFLLPRWQDSVAGVWTPTSRASGFVVDARGLVVTNQRAVGEASRVAVQLTPEITVAAEVLAADPARDVAVLWIDPGVAASRQPIPLDCAAAAKSPAAEDGQEIYAIGAPLRGQKTLMNGTASRVSPRAVVADFGLGTGAAGGPVFTADGRVLGVSSAVDEDDHTRRGDSRVVPLDDVCAVVGTAERKMADGAAPSGTHLPVEPSRPFPPGALEAAAPRDAASLTAYQMSSSDFDITFITPGLAYAARQRSLSAGGSDRGNRTGGPGAAEERERLLTDFGNWSDYVAEFPPVLLVRVTPKLVEGFWTMVARGAARTQGMALPPIKRRKPGFSRMRAFCGKAEVEPIHPFRVEQRVAEGEAMYEGLYAFTPGALGPHCGAVTFMLYSEKEPAKADSRVVEPKLLQQIWQDFAPYRVPED